MENQHIGKIVNQQQYSLSLSYVDGFFGSSNFNAPLGAFLTSVDSVEKWSDRTLDSTFNSQFLVQQNLVSNDMGVYLNRLAALFNEAANNDYTPIQFTQAAAGLEDWVVNNNTVTIDSSFRCNDGAAMLAVTSIAKHSYSYWYNKFVTQQAGVQARGIRGIINAIRTAACDAYGFVVDGWVADTYNGPRNHWNADDAVEGAGKRSNNAGN